MKLENYSIQQGETCYISAMSDIIRYLGYDIDESDIFMLTTGFNVIAETIEGVFSIRCSDIIWDHDIYENMFNNLGISFNAICSLTKTEATKKILDLLEMGLPVLISIDVFYLKYHPEYNKKHEIHIVTIYGLEDDLETAWIADNYVSTMKKSMYIGSIDNFQSAIAINECISYETLFWVIKPTGKIFKNYTYLQIKEIMYISVKKALDLQVHNLHKEGILAFYSFLDYLKSIKNNLNSENTINNIMQLYSMLITRCGMVPTRKLIADFYRKIGNKYNLEFVLIYNEYNNLSHEWTIVAKLLGKLALSASEKVLERIIERIEFIIIREKKSLKIILNKLSE